MLWQQWWRWFRSPTPDAVLTDGPGQGHQTVGRRSWEARKRGSNARRPRWQGLRACINFSSRPFLSSEHTGSVNGRQEQMAWESAYDSDAGCCGGIKGAPERTIFRGGSPGGDAPSRTGQNAKATWNPR